MGLASAPVSDRASSWLVIQTHLTPCGRIFRTTWHTVALILLVSPGVNQTELLLVVTRRHDEERPCPPCSLSGKAHEKLWNTRKRSEKRNSKRVSASGGCSFVPTRCLQADPVRIYCMSYCLYCSGFSVLFSVLFGWAKSQPCLRCSN